MAKMGSKISKAVISGTMLCIDPSSGSGSQADASNCGYALFKEGRCVDSGIIKMDHKIQSWYRLRELVKCKKLGGWVKSDEGDAKYMGYAAIALSLDYEYCRSAVEDHPQNVTNRTALSVIKDLQGGSL